MERFCIITNRSKDEELAVTNEVAEYLKSKGKFVFVAQEECQCEKGCYTDVKKLPENIECIIVIGGDGTLLEASQDLQKMNIPIVGINKGTVGFLADIEAEDYASALDDIIEGNFRIQNHMRLDATVFRKTPDKKGNGARGSALNDVTITRYGFSRIMSTAVYVNDVYMTTYKGDGVIVSTPTGSTGYNLSAGGPVCDPALYSIIITPICPHSLTARSVILPADAKVTIKVDVSKKTQENEAVVSIDGEMISELSAGGYVEIKKSDIDTKIIKFKRTSFMQIISEKLGK